MFIGGGGSFRMTPLYDVLSAWPVAGGKAGQLPRQKLKLAMAVRSKNGHYRLDEIQRRHWNAMARSNAMGMDFEAQIARLIERTPAAIDQVASELPRGFPMRVAEAVFQRLRGSAQHLARMPPS